MDTLLGLPFLLGLDGFALCAALGTSQAVYARRYQLCVLIGLFDAIAFGIGANIDLSLPKTIGAIVTACCGGYVVALAWMARSHAMSRSILWLVPILLSLDNLAAGLAAGQPGLPVGEFGIVTGLTSGAMALAGFGTGARIVNLLPIRVRGFARPALLLAAGLGALLDSVIH